MVENSGGDSSVKAEYQHDYGGVPLKRKIDKFVYLKDRLQDGINDLKAS